VKLKPEDAALLIAQTRSDGTVLIGGQAVAFWIKYFDIEPRLAALTEDIDYLGTKTEAKRAASRLKFPHRLKIATFDDATPSAAVLSVDVRGYPDPVLIDYLASIVGLDSKEISRSAVTIEFQGEPLRVLHPVQLLQSKIWNLYRLSEKRTPAGIEQARLAIEIVAAFIDQAQMHKKELLRAIEAIGRFAATAPAHYARDNFGLDCLKAIPPSVLKEGVLPPAFRGKRWPRILAAAEDK
jgi:hypothetical protein